MWLFSLITRIKRDWYVLNKTQRRGTLVLVCVLFLVLLWKLYDVPTVEETAVYMAQLHIQKSTSTKDSKPQSRVKKDSLFLFDPNVVSENELYAIGLPEKLIHNILNYRRAGGKFYSKESLKKLYAINDSMYSVLEPYVLITNTNRAEIPVKSIHTKPSSTYSYFKNKICVDLNKADSTELEQLKGIGKVLASRIVRYRHRLGGFYSVEQLKEVYGLKDSLYQFIIEKNQLFVDTTAILKIPIRTADFKRMIRHPYFNRDLVMKVLEWQKSKKTIRAEQLQQIVTAEQWNKLKHYIE